MLENISKDLNRYFILAGKPTLLAKIKMILLTQGIWAIIVYRMGYWCVQRKKGIFTGLFLKGLTIFQKIIEILTGISIPFTAKIGKGFYIGHFGGIILGHESIIGEYCNISQGVTIGQAGRSGKQYSPRIGNRVYLAPGSKVFGNICIGDNVAVGANAVVLNDVPDNAVVGGIPAKILNHKGSSDFIITKGNKP